MLKIGIIVGLFFLGEVTMALNLNDKYAVATEKAFNGLNKNTVDKLDEYYDKDAVFQDPVSRNEGIEKIKRYYAHQYENVKSIRFDFSSIIREGDTQSAVWVMKVEHPAINNGKEFTLDGHSLIRFNLQTGKVVFHRDYFDMGEFVYEKIPVLGSIIRFVKNKMKP